MQLLDLPGELLTQILGDNNAYQNSLNKHDYLDLSLANKRLHSLVVPLLYRSIQIKLGVYSNAKPCDKTEVFACDRLVKEPGPGTHVRELEIKCVHGQVTYGADVCLEILRITPNLKTLRLGYGLESESFVDHVTDLLCSGLFTNLTTLSLSCTLCACKMGRLFSISGLQSLSLGYYSQFDEGRCHMDHSALKNPDPQIISASSVSYLSFSSWQPTPSLSKILSLPKRLVKFEARWQPEGTRYSPLGVSRFLFPYKNTLEVLDLTASIDKEDEYEPQETDGTLANFAEFSALRELKCDLDIVLPEHLSGPYAENFADRLPAQLETLAVRNLPRLISTHAHKPHTPNSMAIFDEKLAFVRSLPRAAHQRSHLSSLRSISLYESSYLPGPMCGPYLSPKLKLMQWRNDEKTTWCERSPFPFADVDMSLTAYLSFIVRGWTRRPGGKDAKRRLEEKDARRAGQLEAGLNLDSDDDDVDNDDDIFDTSVSDRDTGDEG